MQASDIAQIFEGLILEGERLVPHGGDDGYNGELQAEYVAWRHSSIAAIQDLGPRATSILKDLDQDDSGPYFYTSSANRVLGSLRAAAEIARRHAIASRPASDIASVEPAAIPAKVFLVHGHDVALREQVARFIQALDIEPVILVEQPGHGRTIIGKLEQHSDVGAAVVLLTPDDTGRVATADGQDRPRARQNVVLELGYFLGKLGRDKVAVLYDESVDLPSDYRGVDYIRVDAEGAWKLKLARELKQAGVSVDMNKAV